MHFMISPTRDPGALVGYAVRTPNHPAEGLSAAFLIVVHNRFHVVSAASREENHRRPKRDRVRAEEAIENAILIVSSPVLVAGASDPTGLMVIESPRESVVVLHIVAFDRVGIRVSVEKDLYSSRVKDHIALVLLDVAGHKAGEKAVASVTAAVKAPDFAGESVPS